MADFEKAFKKTMKFEGGWVNDPNDSGKETYRGVTRKNFPNWPGWSMIDRYKKVNKTKEKLNVALAKDTKLQALIPPFYKTYFWDVIKLGNISSQILAENVFDFGVNAYYRTAAKRLQDVVGVKADGIIGPQTLAAVENRLKSIGEKALVNAYLDTRIAHYDAIVNKKESQKKYYKGWINRCNELRNEVNKFGSGKAYESPVNSNSSFKISTDKPQISDDSNLGTNIDMSKIGKLDQKLQELARKHIIKCKEKGINLNIYCTYRSIKEQDKLYAQGRTTPGKIVTNAKGGQSYHNFGVAYDCGPLLNGRIAWNRTDLFEKIGAIGESIGLEWGGRFKSIIDLPHFQYTGGRSLADFRAGENLKIQNIPHRASGGTVNSYSPYLVGEEGPELFVPDTNGTILNNTIVKALLNNSTNSGGSNIFDNAISLAELTAGHSGVNSNINFTGLNETLVNLNSTANQLITQLASEMGQYGTNAKSKGQPLETGGNQGGTTGETDAEGTQSQKNSETSWSKKLFGDWKATLKESAAQMGDWSTNMKNVVASTAQSMQATMNTVFLDAFQGKLKSFKEYFKSFASSILQSLSTALANSFTNSLTTIISGKKADGGAVTGGNTYLVGERGPELFVANTTGTIIPNHKLGVATSTAAPQVTVNVINNSGQSVSARQESNFDGQGYVVDVWLDALNRNVGGLRDVVLAGR